MSIFTHSQLKERTFFQKIFGIYPEENLEIELNNLFAEKEANLLEIQPVDYFNLIGKYKINFKQKFESQRNKILSSIIEDRLKKNELTDNDMLIFKHVGNILEYNDNEIQIKIDDLKNAFFKEQIRKRIATGYLSTEKKQELETIKTKLKIKDENAKLLFDNEATIVLQDFLKKCIVDGRLSPDEEKELHDMAKSLNAEISFDPDTQKILDKYRLFWRIDNGELPEVESNIHLQTSEKLYFKTNIDWLEERTTTQRVNYGGVSARVRIMKGVYYKIGSVAPEKVTTTEYKKIDNGTLYMTNKRFVFVGNHGNKNISYSKILSFTPYADGVHIDKDSGKSPFFQFSEDCDLFCVLFAKLLSEN